MLAKQIYVITNDINGKQYVGQSDNATTRFYQHKSDKDNCVLHKAIAKYGKEHFSLSILEDNVENYNEREMYWIHKLNTIVPNGYNMTIGGDGYPHYNGEDCYQSKLTMEQVCEIMDLLKNTYLSQTEIGNRYNVAQTIISNINVGNTYHMDNIEYPIRLLEDERVQLIKDLLSQTNLSLNDIAKMSGHTKSSVNNINQGRAFYDQSVEYPIRKNPNRSGVLNDGQIKEIIDLLKNSDLSTVKIGARFGVTRGTIEQINGGKTYYNPDINYPIRQTPAVYSALSKKQVLEIIDLLKNTDMSIRSIAEKYNTVHGTVTGINNGTTKKYRISYENYPIRERYK